MKVGIVYADSNQQHWINIDVPEGVTVEQVIRQSGILEKFPHIDIEEQKVGIYGRFTKLNAEVSDGDRIEIYRKITADPETVPRRNTGDDDDD